MTSLAKLRAHYMRRPLLMTPDAASEIVQRIVPANLIGERPEGRILAGLRKIGFMRSAPQAMHDDDDAQQAAPPMPTTYAPLWAQQTYGEPQDEGFGWALYEGVALIEIEGAISDRGSYYCGTFYHGYDTIHAAIREAMNDSRVHGIFIREKTPGGVVSDGLSALTAYMRSCRSDAGGKPIHVYADMACSAGYWIASAADRRVAPRVGLIG